MKALVITPNEGSRVIDTDASLEDLQGFVGGYIETLPVEGYEHLVAYGNEEGKLVGLTENPQAQLAVGDVGLADGDRLVGPWVFLAYDDEGDNIGLTDDEIRTLLARLT